MELNIKINLDNAAFENAQNIQIEALLDAIKNQINTGYTGNTLLDLNGNTCGKWTFTHN